MFDGPLAHQVLKICVAVVFSAVLFSWLIYPLKRFVGFLGHPPGHNFVGSIKEGRAKREFSEWFKIGLAARAEHMIVLFLNFMLFSYLIAYVCGAFAYVLTQERILSSQTDLFWREDSAAVKQFMMGGFVVGLFMVSAARISAVQHSTSFLRGVLGLLVSVIGLGVSAFIISPEFMTELSDKAFKGSYPSFLITSLPITLLSVAITEIVIDITKGLFPVSRLVPAELFTGLNQLYHERPASFGEEGVRRMAIGLLRSQCDRVPLRSLAYITVDFEEDFLGISTEYCNAASPGDVDVRIITTSAVAASIKQMCGKEWDIRVTEEVGLLCSGRVLLINNSIGMVYQRIPPEIGMSANIGQVIEDYMEVHLARCAFDSLFESLSNTE
jgi:hypothetical protein